MVRFIEQTLKFGTIGLVSLVSATFQSEALEAQTSDGSEDE
ncbi:hypothetical protein ACFQ45_11310 [Rhodanobacter aciditrophus]|uniref:Uncharacterized protein n=1 Tax=Rhodanobacter aciditrophus TaxID=1623218 RepID=A0ABW4B1D6_9GAMM